MAGSSENDPLTEQAAPTGAEGQLSRMEKIEREVPRVARHHSVAARAELNELSAINRASVTSELNWA